MRLARLSSGGRDFLGVRIEEGYADTGFASVDELIGAGERGLDRVRALRETAEPVVAVDRVLAPIVPARIFGTGINFRTHVEENPAFVDPGVPIVNWVKGPHTVIGPNDDIVLPRAGAIDPTGGFLVTYEVEILVVLGKAAKNVSAEEAHEHIFGYTLINDVTSIELITTNAQMMLGKNIDTFAPIGPEIVTADEVQDYDALHISTELNGQVVQDAVLADQITSPERLIEWISSIATLDAGDCISTGTPPGTANWRPEHPYLRAGDTVTVKEDFLGSLTNGVR